LELREYLNVFWKRKLIIIVCVLVFAFAGFIINFAILPTLYKAEAKVLVEPKGKTVIFMNEQSNNTPPSLDIQTYVKLIKSLKVAELAAKELQIQDPKKAALGLTKTINVASDEDTGIIRLSVSGMNPQQCASIANAYANAFVKLSASMASNSIKEVEDS